MTFFLKLLFKNTYRFLKNKSYRTFISLAFKYGDTPRYKKSEMRFSNCKFIVPDCLSFIWQYYEIYVEEFYCFTTQNDHPVVYDCGTNVGLSATYFKKLYPNSTIKAFEADPDIVKILQQNISLNSLQGVEVINKAVWINEAGIDLVSEGADGGSVFLEGKKRHVESIRLKNLLEKEKEIDMLKMDIEGAEVAVIEDCAEQLCKVRNMFLEYHSYQGQSQALGKILTILEQNNFRYFILSPNIRPMPLIYKFEHKQPVIDLQLNIFAYRVNS